jgi:hypothetical protein
MAGKHSDRYFCRCKENIVTTIFIYFLRFFFENKKCFTTSMHHQPPPVAQEKLSRMSMSTEQAKWYSPCQVREMLPVKSVPDNEKWRFGLLTHLMRLRQNKYLEVQDRKHICSMLDILCSPWMTQIFASRGVPNIGTILGQTGSKIGEGIFKLTFTKEIVKC